MGVYKSATEPFVGVAYVREQVHPDIIDSLGEKAVIRLLRRKHKVPRRAPVEITERDGSVEIAFRWFTVETFN